MLHFCSKEDISAVLPTATRFDTTITRARESVTLAFNRFMRRTLEIENMVEYFDAIKTPHRGSYNIWLRKKNIEANTLLVYYSPTWEWDEPDAVVTSENFVLDAVNGKITLFGSLPHASRAIKIAYTGGYPALVVGNIATDVMDCPLELRAAAIDQAIYDLKRTLGLNQGQVIDTEGTKKVLQRPLMAGLLADTVSTLMDYRRPLG